MFKRNLFSIIVVLLFILTNTALGATIVKVDSFDSTFVAPFDSIASETIVEDTIIDTNTIRVIPLILWAKLQHLNF